MALMLFTTVSMAGNNATKSTKTSGFNWNPVMDAIIQVESGGNAKAVSGNSVGAMQIADRYSLEKSKEMFLLIQSFHNPENSVEKAIRAWNGGPNYSVRATNRYYKKVMNKMK